MSIKALYLSVALGMLPALSYTSDAQAMEDPTVSTDDLETIRAGIINTEPESYTIDVEYFSNLFVDKDAPEFAFHTSGKAPDMCADFRGQQLQFTQPSEYTYQFDLSERPELIAAMEEQKCIALKSEDFVELVPELGQ